MFPEIIVWPAIFVFAASAFHKLPLLRGSRATWHPVVAAVTHRRELARALVATSAVLDLVVALGLLSSMRAAVPIGFVLLVAYTLSAIRLPTQHLQSQGCDCAGLRRLEVHSKPTLILRNASLALSLPLPGLLS